VNQRIKNGEFPQIVHEAESLYETQLDTAAELIKERSNELKMVMVSGPSSSGKTTTTLKLEIRLKKMGMKFVPLVVDNYFYDLDMHPKDEFGVNDFETAAALDLEMINDTNKDWPRRGSKNSDFDLKRETLSR
jgi:uridine kinase